MASKEARSFYANIWIAGDAAVATQACREFCDIGLCVTVTPTSFVYTGGMQDGVLVRLFNYPKYPADQAGIRATALTLARFLGKRLFQESFSVEFPDVTEWHDLRAALAATNPKENQ